MSNNTILESSLIFNVMRYWPIKKLIDFKGQLKNTICERSLILAFKEINWLKNATFHTFKVPTIYVVSGIAVINSSTLVVAGDRYAYLYKFFLLNSKSGKSLDNSLIFEIDINIGKLTSLIKLNEEYVLIGSDLQLALIKVDAQKGKLAKISVTNHDQNFLTSGLWFDFQLNSKLPKKSLFAGFQNGSLMMLNESLELQVTIKGLHSFALKFIIYFQAKIITAGGDGKMCVIEPDSPLAISNFQFQEEHQFGIIFMASNINTIITGGTDRYIKVWTLNSKKSIKTIQCFSNIAFSFQYFFDYGFLVSGDCTSKIIINNFYTDDFEVIKSIKTAIVPHFYDADPEITAIVVASKVDLNSIGFLLAE